MRMRKLDEANMGIRVLHVLDKISIDSGVSSVVMNYYNSINHNRVIFDFMLNEEPSPEIRSYIENNGSSIYIMPGLKVANLFIYIKALKEFYRHYDYKIIHGHVANSALFYLGLAKNVPYRIIHSHNTNASDIMWKRIRNWGLNRFIGFVANQRFACSTEAAEFLFGKKQNFEVMYNAVDIDRFSFNQKARDEIRVELGINNKKVIGHIGRFSAQKNHEFIIDIFFQMYQTDNNAILMLIGNGDQYDYIKQKVKYHKLEDVVLFIGTVTNTCDYISAMDIFILPSLFEGLPLVAVEAQASGLPVLLSEKITREVSVTDKVVFLPLQKELWVEEVLTVEIGDRTSAGQRVKKSRFDIETQTDWLCSFYEELLKHEV